MRQIFEKYRPAVVFHAAAYKHVPLMEANPLEAVRNNTLVTRTVADIAVEFGAKRFVLVSTDKAVNPKTVMGQSKALCEWIVEAWGHREDTPTRFCGVRFGNVLGSSGSVIPIFRKQIARGGPVTVTHPEMTRYFMTIPEAVQLVIQAGAIGGRGQVYVLDMGEPVQIVDLADTMIRLSGKEPGRDIAIEFVGARPGEKLHEELWSSDETVHAVVARGDPARHAPADRRGLARGRARRARAPGRRGRDARARRPAELARRARAARRRLPETERAPSRRRPHPRRSRSSGYACSRLHRAAADRRALAETIRSSWPPSRSTLTSPTVRRSTISVCAWTSTRNAPLPKMLEASTMPLDSHAPQQRCGPVRVDVGRALVGGLVDLRDDSERLPLESGTRQIRAVVAFGITDRVLVCWLARILLE